MKTLILTILLLTSNLAAENISILPSSLSEVVKELDDKNATKEERAKVAEDINKRFTTLMNLMIAKHGKGQ